MSAARRLLGLAADAGDAALLGVAAGARREAIIAQGRRRLAQLGELGAVSSEDARAYRLEIQAAVYRMVTGISSTTAPTSHTSESGHHGPSAAMRAMVLMRRDPRRARLFLAASRRTRPAAGGAAPHGVGETDVNERAARHASEDRAAVRTWAHWVLVAIVILSGLALVWEIVIASKQGAASVDPVVIQDAPSPEALSTKTVVESTTPASPSTVSPSTTDPATLSTRAATPDQIAPVIDSAVVAPTSTEARALRARWQRGAAAAFNVTLAEMGTLDPARQTGDDPLALALRQGMLLERLMALHGAAQLLVRGRDAEATRLLDTLPLEASITVPSSPTPTAGAVAASDGELPAMLARVPGPTEARASLLRNYKTRASPPGTEDATALVHEMLKGPSRATRTLARAILIERGAGSLATREAVEARFAEIAADSANAVVLRAVTGVDPEGSRGLAGARAALVTGILEDRGSRITQIDSIERALSATLASTLRAGGGGSDKGDGPAEIFAALGGVDAERESWQAPRALGDSLHLLVENSTALVRSTAREIAARRSADVVPIEEAVVDASRERSGAPTALAQAIANSRGIVALDAIELGLASPRGGRPEIPPGGHRAEFDIATSQPLSERWGARLSALDPAQPSAYLELAEEVFAQSEESDARDLARQLASIAGALDADGLGSSAASLMAALENPSAGGMREGSSRWQAVARRWSRGRGREGDSGLNLVTSATASERAAIVEALAQWRRGYGRRASDRLRDPRTRALFERLMASVPGSSAEFDRLAAQHVSGKPPVLSAAVLDAVLRLERALLVPESASWADALAVGGGAASIDAPIGTPEEIFGVDPTLARWRSGRWVRSDVASSALAPTPVSPSAAPPPSRR